MRGSTCSFLEMQRKTHFCGVLNFLRYFSKYHRRLRSCNLRYCPIPSMLISQLHYRRWESHRTGHPYLQIVKFSKVQEDKFWWALWLQASKDRLRRPYFKLTLTVIGLPHLGEKQAQAKLGNLSVGLSLSRGQNESSSGRSWVQEERQWGQIHQNKGR